MKSIDIFTSENKTIFKSKTSEISKFIANCLSNLNLNLNGFTIHISKKQKSLNQFRRVRNYINA